VGAIPHTGHQLPAYLIQIPFAIKEYFCSEIDHCFSIFSVIYQESHSRIKSLGKTGFVQLSTANNG